MNKNKFKPTIAVAFVALIASCAKNDYINFMKVSTTNFEKTVMNLGQAKQEDFNSIAYISSDPAQGNENGKIANKALNDGYYNVYKKNKEYLKQDLYYSLAATIERHKIKWNIPLVGTLSNITGDLNMKITDITLQKDAVINEEEGRYIGQYLVCSFVAEYNSNLKANFEYIDGTKITLNTNLSGKLEFNDLFLVVIANTTAGDKWSDFSYKIWSATHKAKIGGNDIVSSLISTASGRTIVKDSNNGAETIYARLANEPIEYQDDEYPKESEYEKLFRDPITFLVGAIEETMSYSCKDIYLPLSIKQ